MCGIPWREALHELPAALGNQILACHWLANGVEIEPLTGSQAASAKTTFDEITNREHSWLLEPH
jgi:hypothetical protein